jgi:zinc transport system ATP-binding protein
MKTPLLQLTDISAAYDGKTVLSHVDLTVYERDFLGIIGPNGGGKTTLIKVMLGLLKPTTGDIKYFRQGSEVREITIGYLPQYNQIDKKFPISVREVVESGLAKEKPLWRSFTAEQRQRVDATLKRMGLEDLDRRPIGELSGGQLQRAMLGRALVSNPEVVILDEPNTYIDKKFEARLYSLLEEVNKERAVVLVSHDIGSVLQNVKTIACVNETLDYHPDTAVPPEWLEEHFGCPIDLLGHGNLPHRVLPYHSIHPAGQCPHHPLHL